MKLHLYIPRLSVSLLPIRERFVLTPQTNCSESLLNVVKLFFGKLSFSFQRIDMIRLQARKSVSLGIFSLNVRMRTYLCADDYDPET